MKKYLSCLALLGAGALALSQPALAQTHRFTGNIGGGFTEPVYDLGTRLNTGWNVTAGAGVNLTNRFALMGEFLFNDMNVNQTALNNVGAPDGSTRIWAFTLAPKVNVFKESRANVYLIGGGGVYHRTVEFTQPAVTSVTAFDPWFGFYPANVLTNQVIGSYGVTKGGLNGGAGLEFGIGSGNTKIYAEARYHHMFTTGIASTMVPVTFGIRW
jgi:hypothetical protein